MSATTDETSVMNDDKNYGMGVEVIIPTVLKILFNTHQHNNNLRINSNNLMVMLKDLKMIDAVVSAMPPALGPAGEADGDPPDHHA